MSTITILNNRSVQRFAVEAGISGGIVLLVLIVAFFAARGVGLVDFVGYEWKSKQNYGLVSTETKPVSLVTPVWLNPGDKLIAQYDAKLTAGQVYIRLKKGLIPIPFMNKRSSAYIKQSGLGQKIFTAEEPGVYWPSSKMTSGNFSAECRKRFKKKSALELMAVPDFKCPGTSGSYSILWRVDPKQLTPSPAV